MQLKPKISSSRIHSFTVFQKKCLIKFVDSYRNLTRVALPVKKAFYFKELAERVISLTREQAATNGAVCTFEEMSEHIIINVTNDGLPISKKVRTRSSFHSILPNRKAPALVSAFHARS